MRREKVEPLTEVTVSFWVNGAVHVERTYRVRESWVDLGRKVAADMNDAPALELRPFELSLWGREVCLCVDAGSPNGSVAIHWVDPAQFEGREFRSLLDMIEHPVRVQRSGGFPLAEPYPFKREAYPER